MRTTAATTARMADNRRILYSVILIANSFSISDFISDLLSCRFFLITTRIAYAFYLTQFPIFFYNVGTTRHSGYFHFVTTPVSLHLNSSNNNQTIEWIYFIAQQIQGNIFEIICIIGASVVLTLLFDTPFQNIKKYVLDRNATRKTKVLRETTLPTSENNNESETKTK